LELLIVVAIILIIATIAIPSLLRSRQAANESGAVATIRTVNTAQITYLSSNGGVYGSFTDLSDSGLLDDRFGTGGGTPTVGGYSYTMTLSDANRNYQVDADPASTATGRFDYYSGPDAVVRFGANADNPFPIGIPVQ
jgi:type II secretory pathway pseudopilin PulG